MSKLYKLIVSSSLADLETSVYYFTISAEILARSLANFYRQYADRHMNLKFV